MHYIIVALFLIYCKCAVANHDEQPSMEIDQWGKVFKNSDCRSGSCKYVEKNVESKYGYRSKIPSSMRCAKCRVDAGLRFSKTMLATGRKMRKQPSVVTPVLTVPSTVDDIVWRHSVSQRVIFRSLQGPYMVSNLPPENAMSANT